MRNFILRGGVSIIQNFLAVEVLKSRDVFPGKHVNVMPVCFKGGAKLNDLLAIKTAANAILRRAKATA